MAVTINGEEFIEPPVTPKTEPTPKPPKATKFVQIYSDAESPLYALDSQGVVWQFVSKSPQGARTFEEMCANTERYWVPLPNERRAE